ncbi:MAG: hypothetical protein KGQ79_03120 [Proteobacteria bacterium]|nr:hypothetical protein [Pseudomonadota bacterium]
MDLPVPSDVDAKEEAHRFNRTYLLYKHIPHEESDALEKSLDIYLGRFKDGDAKSKLRANMKKALLGA